MANEQPPFDVLRASFWLLASIIWAQILVGIAAFSFCGYSIIIGAIPVGTCKEVAPDIMELLVGGLAVVVAFSGKSK